MKTIHGAIKTLLLLPGLLLLLNACAAKQETMSKLPETALATDGPPLVIVGEYAGMRLEGYMDRNCMTGYGKMGLRSIGYSRRGDLSVDLPPIPQDESVLPASAAEPVEPLSLAGYPGPGKKRQPSRTGVRAGQPAAQEKPEQERSGLRLASYPTEAEESDNDEQMLTTTRQQGRLEQTNLRIPKMQTASGQEVAAAVPGATEFVCKGNVDAPPTYKGRIRGLLQCTGGRQILFSLRHLGPDQGVGIGKETEDSGLMVLFYHVSLEEAWRRFPSVKEDIALAQQQK